MAVAPAAVDRISKQGSSLSEFEREIAWDVGEGTGPLEYVRGSHGTGPAGTLVFCDTFGFHRGVLATR